jgi:hypothetical protein
LPPALKIAAFAYILLRYFSHNPPEDVLRQLKRHILDEYLFPRGKRKRKKNAAPKGGA